MEYSTHLMRPTSFDANNIDKITSFLFKHLDQYGDPLQDIQKAVDYALSTQEGKGGLVIYLTSPNDEVVGATVINKTGMQDYIPENILVYIAVDQKHRGKGLGKQLIQNAFQYVNGSIALHVEADNPALKLYERMGFENKYLEMRWKNPNS